MPLTETVSMLLHRWLLSPPGGGLWYVQAILCMLLILWLLNNRCGSYVWMTLILTVTYFATLIISTNIIELSAVVFPTFLQSIFSICAMVVLFLFTYRWTLLIKRETSERMRKMSSIIYFLHITAIYVVKIAGRLIGITLSPVWLFGLCAVLLTIMSTILSAPRWSRLSKKLFKSMGCI